MVEDPAEHDLAHVLRLEDVAEGGVLLELHQALLVLALPHPLGDVHLEVVRHRLRVDLQLLRLRHGLEPEGELQRARQLGALLLEVGLEGVPAEHLLDRGLLLLRLRLFLPLADHLAELLPRALHQQRLGQLHRRQLREHRLLRRAEGLLRVLDRALALHPLAQQRVERLPRQPVVLTHLVGKRVVERGQLALRGCVPLLQLKRRGLVLVLLEQGPAHRELEPSRAPRLELQRGPHVHAERDLQRLARRELRDELGGVLQ
mmetsp:Transcript_81762/g.198475  ORF Transcript_81762/g.198475 Transcript_81762/m.198475 type:complete len:260 (+) Transcript_81762:220-999(+)